MSHRKFRAPRHGSLAFLPRKRCRRHRGRIRSFPPDKTEGDPHLTAFIGYKAGMTHVMRELDRPGSKAHKKDIVEAVTIVETPPMIVVGMVGYVKTPAGMRSITTVWAAHMDDSFKRRMYKNWTRSKKKAFSQYGQMWADAKGGEDPKEVKRRLDYIKQYADVVRVVAHSQVKKLKNLKMKKAHVMEIQVNGGKDIAEKVDFAYKLFEKPVTVDTVFNADEMIDTIAVTKGHGFKGVVNRWGVTRLPRKTHRGNRKVACIGAWHPARVQWTVARAGQKGYFHRTELHKKIYRIGNKIEYGPDGKPTTFNATTEFDLTEKNITPLGGFPNYGVVKEQFLMLKGTCPGPRKRPITLRKAIYPASTSSAREEVAAHIKFIDTSSQMGHGRFQTAQERKDWFGPTKKDKEREQLARAKERSRRKAAGEDVEDEDVDMADKRSGSKKRKKGSKKKGSKKKAKTQQGGAGGKKGGKTQRRG